MAKRQAAKGDMARLGLLIRESNEYNVRSWIASVVTIGPREFDRELDHRAIRNPSKGTRYGRSRLYLGDLQAMAYGHENRDPDKVRSHTWYQPLSYHDVFSVGPREAEGMAHTFRLVDKRMEASAAKFGHTRSFGQWLGRFADAIGVTTFVFPRGTANGSSYDDNKYTFHDVKFGIDQVDYLISEWEKDGLTQEAREREHQRRQEERRQEEATQS